jgi:hypothetical protein
MLLTDILYKLSLPSKENEKVKILETYWFIGGGIVRVQTDYEGIKYYIRGYGSHAAGISQDYDAEYIANWGSTFPKAAGDALFGMTDTSLISSNDEDLPSILKYQAE